MNLTDAAKKILSSQDGFIKSNNYEILKVEEHYCELIGNVSSTSLNHIGICHGGYIFGLMDTAAGIAAMTDGRVAVTVSSNIEYFKQCKGNKLKAVAKANKVGKTVGFFEVVLLDEEDDLLAKANINYIYLNKEN